MVKIGAERRNSRQEESESSFHGRKKQRTKTPQEVSNLQPIQISKTNPNVQSSTWTPPAENWKKINIDGSWVARSGESNAGAVVRDADGTILAAGSFSTGSSSSAELSEAKAANKAIQLAILLGYDNVVFESYSKKFVEEVIRRRQGSTPTDFTELEQEISSFLHSAEAITSWTVTFESPKSDNVAHSLAARRVFMASDTMFFYPLPDWLVNLGKQDVTNYSSANHTPVTRRYNTRQSKAVLQGHTPASAPAVKNVSATSIPRRPWTAIRGKFTEGSIVSQPSSGEERSFPSPEDIANFTSDVCKEQSPDEVTKITSAILKENSPDEVQDEIPLFVPEPAVNNHLPTKNAREGSNNIGTGGDNCGGSPATPLSVSEPAASKNPHEGSNNIGNTWDNCGKSPPRSVNITAIAAMLDGVIYDEDEIGSGPSLVTVHGYRVREQVASLLGVIIEKYGDIAEKCTLKGKSSRSTQLEVLCGIVQRLKRLCFKDISSSELETIRTEISDLASLGLDVGWLQQRVEMVSKALSLFWGAATLMEKRRDNREEIELHKKEFEKLEKEIEEMVKRSEAEAEKIEKLKVEGEEIEEMMADINLTLKGFLGGESLVQGLL